MSDLSAVVMGAVLILAGLGLVAFMRRRHALVRASQAWPAVPGTVLESAVRRYGRSVETRWRYYPAVRYRYEVEGRAYTGRRLYFDEMAWASRSSAARLAHKYPPGATVTVRYDPDDPARALLEPGLSGAGNYGVVGCALVVVGLFFVVYLGFVK